MRLFSEEVTPTFTNSNLNILTVKDFNEVFFDVYELEINGKKYVTEKVSEYKGSPVINIQLTHKGNEYTAPCVLNKGQFNFLVNEQTFQYVGKSQEIDDSLFEQPTVDEVEEIVFEKHESILEDIQNAKRSAQEYLIKVKEQHEAKLAKSHIKNSKKIKRELESIRNDLVEEFLQIATNNYSDLHKSNEELKSYILENVNKIVSSLEKDVKTKSETLEISLEERFNEFARDITNGVLAKEIKESRQVVTDSINSVLNAVDNKLTTIDKANIELNDAITKTSNKALSRIGNVKVQLQEEIAKNVEIIQHDISKSIDKIKTIYDNRIKVLSEDNNKLNEDTKKECIKLVTESRDSLLSVINDIKVEVPNIIIEKEGKPFKEIDIKKVKAELEKNITSRFTSEMASIKRMIELMSGGGSVAKQFADGGVMNGNLTVVGAISASQYLGIPGGGGVSGDYLPLSGGTVDGNLIVNGAVNLNGDGIEQLTASYSDAISFTSGTSISLNSLYGPLTLRGSDVYINSDSGIIKLSNSSLTDFNLLQLGGTTASFPAIKRNGSGIDIRDAADAGFTNLRAANITASGTLSANSLILATEIVRYDPNPVTITNPATFTLDNGLSGIPLTAGIWTVDFYFDLSIGNCGAQPKFGFDTASSVTNSINMNTGMYVRGNQNPVGLGYTTTAPAGFQAIGSNGPLATWTYAGSFTVTLSGNSNLSTYFQRTSSAAGTSITRKGNAYLRACKIA